jgi:hypothetical protein
MKEIVSRLISSVWLFLWISFLAFASPNLWAAFLPSPNKCSEPAVLSRSGYDGQSRAHFACDDFSNLLLSYDGAQMLTAGETESQRSGCGFHPLAKFADFLAAEGTMATREGIIGISEHLTQLPGGGGIDAANSTMYSRLTTAVENGKALTGTDAAFYQHELLESSLMDSGMGARAAHLETLGQQGIPYAPGYEAQLYHPTVSQQFPTSFSPAARAAAGIH